MSTDLLLKQKVEKALADIRDPSTGMGLGELPLVRKITVVEDGVIVITLRPSSPVCPLIFKLGNDIKRAVLQISEVKKVFFRIKDHQQATAVEEYLAEA